MAAYKAFNGDMRDNIIRVYVPDRDNAIGYIKADYTDKEEKPIYVGYSKEGHLTLYVKHRRFQKE